MSSPPADTFFDSSTSPGESIAPRRSLLATIKRRPVLLLTVFCVICSAVFLTAPLLDRSYQLSGTMQVRIPGVSALPELERLPDSILKDSAVIAREGPVVVGDSDAALNGWHGLNLSCSAKSRELGVAHLRSTAQFITAEFNRRAADMVADYLAAREKKSADLAKQEQELSLKIDTFRLAHRAALPEDPNSTISQFEKLVEKMDGKQQRLQIVIQQIARLRDYKKASEANGGHGELPALPDGAPPVPAVIHPENDPEVAAFNAQLQLLNKQIEEQLTTMGRKEQHPYVVDLRNQQAALQKKLAAAKERAAAGKPAPVDATLTQSAGHPADSGLTTVDINLQNAEAERDALDAEVKSLAKDREALQKKVDEVLPLRQELEKLNANLAAVQHDRLALRTQAEEFARQLPALPAGDNSAILDIKPLAIAATSTLPIFPRLPQVYSAGLALALAAAVILALALHRTDRVLHTVLEASQILGVPILGTVSEIRSSKEQRRRKLWRVTGRPLIVLTLLGLTAFAAIYCYERLAGPLTNDPATPRAAASLLSPVHPNPLSE